MKAGVSKPLGHPGHRARRDAPRQRFVWQGVLIIMPAILLAGFGLISLRKDRSLALQGAAQEAERLATNLAQSTLPRALFAALPPDTAMDPVRDGGGLPEHDPVFKLASSPEPRMVWLAENLTNLVFPPPITPLPRPEPLAIDGLSAPQQQAWLAVRDSSAENTSNALAAAERLQSAPPRFAAMAWYRVGLLQLTRNQLSQARRSFERVRTEFPREVSEAGYPLSTYAGLQLLRIASVTGRPATGVEELGNRLCRQAVLEPSALSVALLDQVASVTADVSSVERWRRLWQAHQRARTLHRQAQLESGGLERNGVPFLRPRWIGSPSLGTERWLVAARLRGHGVRAWFVAVEEDQVRRVVDRVLEALPRPDYLGVSVSVGERQWVPLPGTARTEGGSAMLLFQTGLAGGSSTGDQPASEPGEGAGSERDRLTAKAPEALTLSVYLTSPEKLHARQRARRLWSIGLITASVAAVLIGFVTAWRAFRRQQQLVEMKSNFVSAVSHELRSPIASIRLMSEELEDLGSESAARSGEYHRLISRECRRLSALIENVLDFSRHEQGREKYQFQSTELTALVRATVNLMQPCAAERMVNLRIDSAPPAITAEADARALQQALVNLIDNAIKHSPEHGIVTVGLDRVGAVGDAGKRLPGETAQAPGSGDGWVRLWVEDDGPGIPPEDHGVIFERFHRRGSELRRETPGIGLGLAIVKYVAEAHGGRVRVRSAVGRGSRFTLELPMSHHAEETA